VYYVEYASESSSHNRMIEYNKLLRNLLFARGSELRRRNKKEGKRERAK
jgi:hypothetical protein